MHFQKSVRSVVLCVACAFALVSGVHFLVTVLGLGLSLLIGAFTLGTVYGFLLARRWRTAPGSVEAVEPEWMSFYDAVQGLQSKIAEIFIGDHEETQARAIDDVERFRNRTGQLRDFHAEYAALYRQAGEDPGAVAERCATLEQAAGRRDLESVRFEAQSLIGDLWQDYLALKEQAKGKEQRSRMSTLANQVHLVTLKVQMAYHLSFAPRT